MYHSFNNGFYKNMTDLRNKRMAGKYVGTKPDVSVSNHVPFNSVSAGHPVMGKPEKSVAAARRRMKIAAGLIIEEELNKIDEKQKVKKLR